jgi:hypothetical protein
MRLDYACSGNISRCCPFAITLINRDEDCERGGEWMSSEPSKNVRAYKTAAILFSISGLLFIIVFGISRNMAFLPIGIALFIISIVFWKQSKKLTDKVSKDEN